MPQEALPYRWDRSNDNVSFHRRIPVDMSRPRSCDWVKLDELGEVLLIAGENYELSLWDLGRSRSLWKYSVTQVDSSASQPAPLPSEEEQWKAICEDQKDLHRKPVNSISAFKSHTLEGTLLMMTSCGEVVQAWNASNMQIVWRLHLPIGGDVWFVEGEPEDMYCMSQDGARAIIILQSGRVVIYNITGDTPKEMNRSSASGRLDVCAISHAAGRAAATSSEDGALYVWDIETGELCNSTKFGVQGGEVYPGMIASLLDGMLGTGWIGRVGGLGMLPMLVLMESKYGQELLHENICAFLPSPRLLAPSFQHLAQANIRPMEPSGQSQTWTKYTALLRRHCAHIPYDLYTVFINVANGLSDFLYLL
ncbi:hypothetical protein VOLCADRAFT_93998 [Volvox carteri f. nagariensis]|uniref:Uncharacterized protein n=1 Tax=Volvox carteri f. nagariensis TaxID=3068 RepID=D8U3M9_VOLCA|nr:uncharacterized protein VOLCADRAFT_93998 [Volvox carteri f. nagariensis]EFJ45558.1 hypothetical protein VOLCADRAFT_93998 [Volvox carteri f. nagariensis]|eukprot:XP_002953248.1 hypothetical protein VOLCADRAFT_93998 [Volvox carteri f. nagariensis]